MACISTPQWDNKLNRGNSEGIKLSVEWERGSYRVGSNCLWSIVNNHEMCTQLAFLI